MGASHVYGMDASTGVLALDAEDGAPAWATDITATPTVGTDIQPVIASSVRILRLSLA